MQERKKAGPLAMIAVWGGMIVGSVALWTLTIALVIGGCQARADSIAALRWDVETSRPGAYMIDVFRGETVRLEPRYVSYGAPLDLSGVYDVVLRYRSRDMAEGYYYAVTGAVHAVDSGRVSINWTPAAEAPAAAYEYTIAAKSLDGDTLRAFGGLRLRGSVAGVPTNQPTAITTFDWASVEHVNPEDAPFLTDFELSALQATVSALETSKVSVIDFQSTNAMVWAAIADAQGMASMGGDVSGPSTNATVVAIRGVGVAEIAPDEETDTYVLTYDHATGTFILAPAGGGGLFEGNILRLNLTAQASDVLFDEVGMYRTIRPGNLPSAVINVAGTEIAWFDLLGMTMRYGSIHLLSDELSVNVAAYDGSAAAPAYTWAGGKTLGKYRFSYGGDYAEGFAVNSNRVWYWGNDGIHLDDGMEIFGSGFVPDATGGDGLYGRRSTGGTNVWELLGSMAEEAAADYGKLGANNTWTGTQTFNQHVTMGSGKRVAGSFFGESAGATSSGTLGMGVGHYAAYFARGNGWNAFGSYVGQYASWTNSAAFGRYAGRNARGNNRMYLDVYGSDPSYLAGGATNDTIFLDSDGTLYLGGGAARAENPSAGGVLRGTWSATDDFTAPNLARLPYDAGTNAVTLYTPLHVGHQLIRSGGSNEVWQAFGTTTNDWVKVWP